MVEVAIPLLGFRRTIIVHGSQALREERLRLARQNSTGVQVMAIEHMAERLAGGFLRLVDMPTLKTTITNLLPEIDIGEFEPIKMLPGFVSASAATLQKFWLSDSELIESSDHPRVQSLRVLEAAVVEALPRHMRTPADIIALAIGNAHNARTILGNIEIKGMTDVHPAWRPLLMELSAYVNVTFNLGPRKGQPWMAAIPTKKTCAPFSPDLSGVSCATTRHEALESYRWARSLMASGVAPDEIAIASVSSASYDEHMIAMENASRLGVHFVHGYPAVNTRDGQIAAALTELMLRGLSQKKVRRFVDLIGPGNAPFEDLPSDWTDLFNEDAALATVDRWKMLFSRSRHDKAKEVSDALMPFLRLASKGSEFAEELGVRFLPKQSLALWKRALTDGPAEAIDRTIRSLRVPDGRDPATSPCFMSAESLAASPRKYVRLLGLTSRSWPRRPTEDPLVPDHIIPSHELDPMALSDLDRRDFETIIATTEHSVVFSWSRRDAEGRALGISSLVPESAKIGHDIKRLTRVPEHAMSDADRLYARANEFSKDRMAMSATRCWSNWNAQEVTENDGLLPPNHPRIRKVFEEYHSATSIRLLLRDPLGFVWKYGLGFHVPEYEDEPLTPDPREFGNIVHAILRRVVETMGRKECYANHSASEVEKAITDAAFDIARLTQTTRPVPPGLVWKSMMDRAVSFATAALLGNMDTLEGQISYAEVPFGGKVHWERDDMPWDAEAPVYIPGTDLKLFGFIDRVDLSPTTNKARVIDYKTGKVPKKLPDIVIGGGAEIQRCIYGFATKTLIGGQSEDIESGLFYPSGSQYAPLADLDMTLDIVARAVILAKENIEQGGAVPGEDSKADYNDARFALPSNHSAGYLTRKWPAIMDRMGEAAEVWEHA